MRKSTGKYPKDWPKLAKACKERAGWRCERCGKPQGKGKGHGLNAHHLDWNRSNRNEWDICCICAGCHLIFQHKYQGTEAWLFDFTELWLKSHQDGFYAWVAQKVKEDIAKS
jgi:hypothetical protein